MVRTPTASTMSPRLSMVPRAFSDGNWKPPVGAAAAGAGPAAVTSLMFGKLLGSICRVHGYWRVNGGRCTAILPRFRGGSVRCAPRLALGFAVQSSLRRLGKLGLRRVQLPSPKTGRDAVAPLCANVRSSFKQPAIAFSQRSAAPVACLHSFALTNMRERSAEQCRPVSSSGKGSSRCTALSESSP